MKVKSYPKGKLMTGWCQGNRLKSISEELRVDCFEIYLEIEIG